MRTLAIVALAPLFAAACNSSSPATSLLDAGSDAHPTKGDAARDATSPRDAAHPKDADATTDASSGPPSAAPLATESPWPKFRRDMPQDGRSRVLPSQTGGTAFTFTTGKGVFSSPIVGADETVYVGSADQSFYALTPAGALKWKIATGEIIDSSGLLDDKGELYFGSGDGELRAVNAQTGAVTWTFTADSAASTGAYLSWFEGNVAIGQDGTLYAPNDDYRVFAIDRTRGTAKWRFTMPDQTWSLPAIDTTGNLYLGNNELLALLGKNTYSIAPDGGLNWSTSSPGTVAASPVLTSDGKVIVGGFDGFFHAYDAKTGASLWSTAARDHIYASSALLSDGTVIGASADGSVYALDPSDGHVKWTFDTPEPIRSSPAVDGEDNIYFGGGDGVLYVLTKDGALRWSLILIDEPRRNLNASPALGNAGIYLGGENGGVFGVPYDQCLRPSQATNPRCSTTAPFTGLPDGATFLYDEPFGGTDAVAPQTIDANQALAFTLRVRKSGQTQLAILDAGSLTATANGIAVPASNIALAGNGQFFVITPPDGGFTPDGSGNVTFAIRDNYLVNLTREGLALEADSGTPGGTVSTSFTFALNTATPFALPLPFPTAVGDPSGVFEVSRLSLPLPTILPSYNQIGFDSLVYLVGLVQGTGTPGTTGIAWMAGAKYLTGQTQPVIDPATQTLLPLVVTYDGSGLLTLENTSGISVDVQNTIIPLDSFRLSARLDATGNAVTGGRLTGDTVCASVPTYGVFLEKLGFCNPETDLLTVFGASNLGPYESGTTTGPSGVGTVTFSATATGVTATLTGGSLVAADHVASVLMLDAATGLPVPGVSYGLATTTTTSGATLASVTVPFPTGSTPPSALTAYLMIDTYPAATGSVTVP